MWSTRMPTNMQPAALCAVLSLVFALALVLLDVPSGRQAICHGKLLSHVFRTVLRGYDSNPFTMTAFLLRNKQIRCLLHMLNIVSAGRMESFSLSFVLVYA